ncbi:MAG: SDR family oxidoreductase [Bacteroidota bacterium]
MQSIQNKKVLIIGATGDIGSETARLIKQSGGHLYLSGRDQNKLQALATELNLSQDNIFPLDITDEAAIVDMAEQIHSQIGQLDVLINASGIGVIKSVESLSLQEFQSSLNTNLVGPFLLLKYFLPAMKAVKQGLIINIPGVLGKTPMAGAAAYAASKYGLNGMLKSVREELKRTQIRITNIYLGGVNSAFWDDIDLRVPHDKMITPKEAARSIWFLCQQPSSSVVSEMVLQPFYHQAI